MFITLEGIEGCGKSTQIHLLADHLQQVGQRVVVTREPGGCPIANQIRSILLDAANNGMIPMAELMLYAAARAQHVNEVIRPALSGGAYVVCDRFSDATRAYQSSGRGITGNVIEVLNDLACDGLVPDLTILLDCPVETGIGRARQRIEAGSGPREERFELESLAFHQRVRDGYLTLAAADPARFVVIDATGTPDQVSARIVAALVPHLEGRP